MTGIIVFGWTTALSIALVQHLAADKLARATLRRKKAPTSTTEASWEGAESMLGAGARGRA